VLFRKSLRCIEIISCVSFDWISAELAVAQVHDPRWKHLKGESLPPSSHSPWQKRGDAD
jgi:hypothetical protein